MHTKKSLLWTLRKFHKKRANIQWNKTQTINIKKLGFTEEQAPNKSCFRLISWGTKLATQQFHGLKINIKWMLLKYVKINIERHKMIEPSNQTKYPKYLDKPSSKKRYVLILLQGNVWIRNDHISTEWCLYPGKQWLWKGPRMMLKQEKGLWQNV